MPFDYLAELNPEQRRAVEHGVKAGSADRARPLLVIAGAGTGKTKTLAHRVAHLIVNGISPHRILLLTFSRRAAVEMTRRVERITAAALGAGHRGRERFTPLAPGCSGNSHSRLGLSHHSRFLIGRTLPT